MGDIALSHQKKYPAQKNFLVMNVKNVQTLVFSIHFSTYISWPQLSMSMQNALYPVLDANPEPSGPRSDPLPLD